MMNRYFLALLPPEPILSKVYRIKEHFRDEYNCKAPLRSPPHITLHMPFLWKEKKDLLLINKLVQATKELEPFTITLENFGAFPPRVIYIGVKKDDALLELQAKMERFAKQELNLFNATRYNLPYQPHMTVAFRDLKNQIFPQAWAAFENKKFNETFEVKSFHLLKHDGKGWNSFKEFHFGNI